MMNIGDKIRCSNNHTYTLNEVPGYNGFLLIDETGKEINIYEKDSIRNCMPHLGDIAHLLCVENNNKIEYVKIIEFKKGDS
jgi:hypothetical protein